jgi:hypothetical protein
MPFLNKTTVTLLTTIALGAGCDAAEFETQSPTVAPHSAAQPLTTRATLAGCPVFPADNEWNRRVDGDAVDPRSQTYLAGMNAAGRTLHPDFGGAGEYGIPWIAVSGAQPRVPMSFDYESDSDPGPYPIPATAPIEGGPDSSGDRHVLVVDKDNCHLYETFDT